MIIKLYLSTNVLCDPGNMLFRLKLIRIISWFKWFNFLLIGLRLINLGFDPKKLIINQFCCWVYLFMLMAFFFHIWYLGKMLNLSFHVGIFWWWDFEFIEWFDFVNLEHFISNFDNGGLSFWFLMDVMKLFIWISWLYGWFVLIVRHFSGLSILFIFFLHFPIFSSFFKHFIKRYFLFCDRKIFFFIGLHIFSSILFI